MTRWRKCLGATDPQEAKPDTLRRLYGQSKLKNVAHGCNTAEDVTEVCLLVTIKLYHTYSNLYKIKLLSLQMLELFFGNTNGAPNVPLRATFKNCTCCVIKPHVLIEGNLGAILDHISASEKFNVTAMAMFSVKLQNAKEFYEIYKEVLPEYQVILNI